MLRELKRTGPSRERMWVCLWGGTQGTSCIFFFQLNREDGSPGPNAALAWAGGLAAGHRVSAAPNRSLCSEESDPTLTQTHILPPLNYPGDGLGSSFISFLPVELGKAA